ncbi:amidase signature domain-containing protein [Phaeosphaeriaceae sp. PMI808]|nr:amidase signature domain-containing protein [Phaeosphaeriaceae sp. PMI808]
MTTDETTKPEVPDAKAQAQDIAPTSALSGLKQVDRTILRLNKLLASPGGLSAFLSTFNYSLYILAYLQTKSSSVSAFATKLLSLIRPACDDAKIPATTLLNTASVPPIAVLAVLVSKARTTLRLFGLFPLYAWLRTLVAGPKPGADAVLHRIALLQASSYFTYQALENICLLADSGVVSPSFIAAINRGDSKTGRVYLWAYRAWLGGVSCDFVRLAREWQLEHRRRVVRKQMQIEGRALAEHQDEEDDRFDKRWWTDVMIAGAWFPMALHFSSAAGGIPGWNLGVMGVCGLVAGNTRVKAFLPIFDIVEASIDDHRRALDTGVVTAVDLVVSYLNRIATYDICGGLNAFTVFNANSLDEARASDARRAQGLPSRLLEGIPYSIKDSYKVAGLSVTNGSPALEGLMSSEDSAIAAKLREAGAVLLGKTNMPPMAAGGMQRGLYGRAESAYNSSYLTAAFSSGSSNGAATSVATSMAAFGMGSETVSSGRSPASNNALVCYTPSKGILSCRGLWPLYVTCDVPVPYARSMNDLLVILDVIATEDGDATGDFFRSQTHIPIPKPLTMNLNFLKDARRLNGKRIGVPKMYIGQKDSDPHAKQTEQNILALGAEIIYTDFPLVTNYENDSISGEANNVSDGPANLNHLEPWESFLIQNDDPRIKSLSDIRDPAMLFPKPPSYLPDTFLEVRNWIDYAGLPSLIRDLGLANTPIHDIPGMPQALGALEAQRKRDLEDWMTRLNIDILAFPAQGDVGHADLEFKLESTQHSLRNGVKYSNGNRAIRHLGVPTVSVPMGRMKGKGMPVNVTFAGRAYCDDEILSCAWAFEQATKRRVRPGLEGLETIFLGLEASVRIMAKDGDSGYGDKRYAVHVLGQCFKPSSGVQISIYIDGKHAAGFSPESSEWSVQAEYVPKRPECLGWDLNPLPPRKAMVMIVAQSDGARTEAILFWVDYTGKCR